VDDDTGVDYPWLARRDERFTLALVLDVGEVLVRHGYPAPAGVTLVELTAGLYRALTPHRLPATTRMTPDAAPVRPRLGTAGRSTPLHRWDTQVSRYGDVPAATVTA
jgi:hypothetical protein